MKYTNEAIHKRKVREYRIYQFISIMVYILLFPLIVYNVSLIAQSILRPGQTPSFLGIKTYVIISGSMEPNYNIGDIVVVQETNPKTLKVGDVISFREGENVVTHRISRELKDGNQRVFKTKGDNNNTEDLWEVSMNSIEGKVITAIPAVGKITLMLQDKVAILFVILVFYAYIVRSHKIKLRNELRKEKRLKYEKSLKADYAYNN